MLDNVNPQSNKSSSVMADRPFDIISLPSKGKLYTHPQLSGLEKVECYYLTAKEEDILTSPNLIKSGELFDSLLKSILRTKIPVEKLTLGDRNAILIWTRINAYGKDYPVSMRCASCNEMFENVFNLSILEIRELQDEPEADGTFILTLPKSKKVVKIKFMTSEDEKQVFLAEKGKIESLKTKISNSITLRHQRILVEVDGNRDSTNIRSFIENMAIEDSRFIRHFLNEKEPCVIMKQLATCTNCTVSQEVDIPLTENFFWPDI
jgi:hypothetical protein